MCIKFKISHFNRKEENHVCKKRRDILRRSEPRGRKRTRRYAPRTYRPERRGQPSQPAAITSQKDKSRLPTHISINADRCGLAKDSIVLLEQVRTLDKQRLKERMGELDEGAMNKVDNALSVSFGLSGNN